MPEGGGERALSVGTSWRQCTLDVVLHFATRDSLRGIPQIADPPPVSPVRAVPSIPVERVPCDLLAEGFALSVEQLLLRPPPMLSSATARTSVTVSEGPMSSALGRCREPACPVAVRWRTGCPRPWSASGRRERLAAGRGKVPGGRRGGAEEARPHVVLQADTSETCLDESRQHTPSHEAARAPDYGDAHLTSGPGVVVSVRELSRRR